jgi:CDP-diacylglycerol--serine O-phosphatidyltransferase
MLGAIVTVFTAFSMVSNIKFYSFKEFHFHHRARFRALLIALLLLVLLVIDPELVIYTAFVLYVIISYLIFIFRIAYTKKPKIEDNQNT